MATPGVAPYGQLGWHDLWLGRSDVWVLLLGWLMAPAMPGLATMVLQSEGDCPSPQRVRKRMEALTPDRAGVGGVVHIRHAGDRLELELELEGQVVRRSLPRPADCADEAELVATVLAAWQGAAWQGAARVASPSGVARAGGRAVTPELEAAYVNALAVADYAPAGTLGVRLGLTHTRFGVLIGVLGEAEREVAVGNGRARWGRSALRGGADVQLLRGRFALDLRAEAWLGLLYLRGVGFSENFGRFDVDAGLSAGLRAGVRIGRFRPTLGVDAVGWLRPSQAYVQRGGAQPDADLPRFELLLSAGLIVGLGARR